MNYMKLYAKKEPVKGMLSVVLKSDINKDYPELEEEFRKIRK